MLLTRRGSRTRAPVVVTLAELHAGVQAAVDVETRARRMATLETIVDVELVPVDEGTGLMCGPRSPARRRGR